MVRHPLRIVVSREAAYHVPQAHFRSANAAQPLVRIISYFLLILTGFMLR